MCLESYLAGLFDGEGCVSVRYNGRNYYLSVQFLMSNHEVMLFLSELGFGGNLHTRYPNGKNRCTRLEYAWTISGKRALEFLRVVEPHVIVKKKEVEVALRYPLTYNVPAPVSPETNQIRKEISDELHRLKREDVVVLG